MRRQKREDGEFLRHGPCEKCGSSDAKAYYDNNTAHCFSCKGNFYNCDGDEMEDGNDDSRDVGGGSSFLTGTVQDIPNRRLREPVCAKFGYAVGELHGEPCHIAPYREPKTGQLIAQKIRRAGKKFMVIGNGKNLPFFGQHLYNGGKTVCITEGEVDALSLATAMGDGKWPVVSLPNGASSAEATIKGQYDWLDSFEQIVLCFDQDDAGREALEVALPLLPPGKAYTMSLPRKDANEVLIDLGTKALTDAFWNKQQWRPDGIVAGNEIDLEALKSAVSKGFDTRLPAFNTMYGGIRKREVLLLTAGSGIGKSTLAREIAYGLHQDHGLTIGNVFLEESKEKTAQGYIAIDNDIPLGRLRTAPATLSDAQWAASYAKVVRNRMYFYDHFGSLESERLLSKLRYMAVALKCDFIVLDHISIVVSGQEASNEGERRDIDRLMTNLRSLVEETGVGIVAIVHLKQPEGKPHEEGGRVTLSQLRGSGSLKQLSDGVVALERDQQGEQPNVCHMRILKNREFGDTGEADTLSYNKDSGRLLPTDPIGEFGELDV